MENKTKKKSEDTFRKQKMEKKNLLFSGFYTVECTTWNFWKRFLLQRF